MKQINLYQAVFHRPVIILPARKMAISGGFFAAGLLALYLWGGWQLRQLQTQVDQLTKRADAVTRQVQASSPGQHQADPAVAEETQKLEARLHALQLAQDAIASGEIGAETGYSAQFRALARAVGNTTHTGAWLTGVTLFDNGRSMTLHGRALSGGNAARLISNLRAEPLFVGMSFAGLTLSPPEAGEPHAGMPNLEAKPAKYLVFSLNARSTETPSAEAALARLKLKQTGTMP